MTERHEIAPEGGTTKYVVFYSFTRRGDGKELFGAGEILFPGKIVSDADMLMLRDVLAEKHEAAELRIIEIHLVEEQMNSQQDAEKVIYVRNLTDAMELEVMRVMDVKSLRKLIRADYWPHWVESMWQARGDIDVDFPEWFKVDWEASAIAKGLVPVDINGVKYYAVPNGVEDA